MRGAHGALAVSDQPKRVRRLGRREPARPRPAPDQHRRRGRSLGELAADPAEALLAPALGEADDEQAGALGERDDRPRGPGSPSSGSATMPAVAGRSATRRQAGGSRRARPRRSSDAAPISRSGASVARATQAPSSSAAQSCHAAPKGTITGPARSEPPASTSRATSHGACSRTTPASPSSGERPASMSSRSTSSCDARRTTSSPGAGEENAAVRAARPRREQLVPARGERRRGRAELRRLAPPPRRSARAAAPTPPAAPRARAAARDRRACRARPAASDRATARASAPRTWRSAAQVERRILLEDRPLEPLELLARLQSQLLRELAAGLAVGVERLGLPAGAVEREHQLAAQALPQRMLGDERLELADQLGVAAAGQIGVDPLLERRQPQLLETGDLGLRERLVGEVGERRPAPKRERLAQLLRPPLSGVPSAPRRRAARSGRGRAPTARHAGRSPGGA